MAQKNISILVCDRCGRTLDTSKQENVYASRMWGVLGEVLLCPSDKNAFEKFMRGGGVKALNAA